LIAFPRDAHAGHFGSGAIDSLANQEGSRIMGAAKKSRRRGQSPSRVASRRQVERLEDRRLMAVLAGQSTFDPDVMGANIELMSTGNAVGYGYAVSYQGNPTASVGGDGQARTDADDPAEAFSSLTEMDISSVSKTVTATAILHLLQSQPGGLDAALTRPLSDFVPTDWTPGANTQFITIRHLLTHTSGLSESNNPIGVDFNSPSNATYTNLRALVQAGVAPPTVGFDGDYNGPRWGGSYNNANFAILARVVLPKLVNPGINLTAANYADRDLTSGTMYKQYVQDEIFEPLGIVGADLDVTDPNPTLGYVLGQEDQPGLQPVDRTRTGGAGGWKMDARELARFLDGIQRDNSILTAATRQLRDDQELGWYQNENAFGESFTHNGANGGASGMFRSQIVAMPHDVEVAYLMNSGVAPLPGASIFNMLETAYINAWTELTVGGTSGNDDFVIRLNNSGFQPSIEVEVNGDVEFVHWISTLDSLTLNGGLGNDTFTIEGFSAAIDLQINGSWGDDEVIVLPGSRNIEAVNGMTFDGGFGNDSITVNDQNNAYSNAVMSRMYTVTSGSVARFIQNPLFPGNPGMFLPVVVGFSGVENLDLATGGQNDVVNVVSKTSGETSIRTGNGDDVIVVAQTAGDIGTVDGLQVDGQNGLDTIRVYDHNVTSGDPQATGQYDVDSDSVARYVASVGGISNGEPTPVEVHYDNVESLELTTTDMVDVIRLHTALTGTTTIHGGAGGDILNASPDGRNLELVDDLTFYGDAGIDSIVLNDQNNPYSHPSQSRVYEVTAAGVERTAAMPNTPWLIPVTINVAYSSVEELTLRTGGQADEVNVESVPSAGATIQTGLGNDVVNASPAAANMETVNGLHVDGGAGVDAFHIHDQNNPYELPGGGQYTITPDSVRRFAEHVLFDNVAVPVEVGFAGVESVSLVAGNQGDTFRVEGEGTTTALSLDGNSGSDHFIIDSPAFTSIDIQGDAPIFAPGDRLTVNEDGLYATASIPGLYPAGSGGVTIGASAIHYSGIETPSVQAQIYGGPGDFDSDGDVDGVDLTHATLGWKERFGDDLSGSDFLTWQRHLGENRVPRQEAQAVMAPAAAEAAPTPAIALETQSLLATGDKLEASSLVGIAPSHGKSSTPSRPGQRSRSSAVVRTPVARSQRTAFAAYESELATVGGGPGAQDSSDNANESALDEAFASIGAVLAAI
jgi:CubicO group peptidase (beta-lactamase class C family)